MSNKFSQLKKLATGFQTAYKNNQLPDYYRRTLGNGTDEFKYNVVLEMTHDTFCNKTIMDHSTASKKSVAAHAISDHADTAFKQKKISKPVSEKANRLAALLEPDDITIVDNWVKSTHGISQPRRKALLESMHGELETLQLHDSYLGDTVIDRMEVLRDNMAEATRKKIADDKRKAAELAQTQLAEAQRNADDVAAQPANAPKKLPAKNKINKASEPKA